MHSFTAQKNKNPNLKKKKKQPLKNIKDIELFLSANLNTTPYLSL